MFTWDYAGGVQGNREMDIEITRWGEPANKNVAICGATFLPGGQLGALHRAGGDAHDIIRALGDLTLRRDISR